MLFALYIFLSIIGLFALVVLWSFVYAHFALTKEEKDAVNKNINDWKKANPPAKNQTAPIFPWPYPGDGRK